MVFRCQIIVGGHKPEVCGGMLSICLVPSALIHPLFLWRKAHHFRVVFQVDREGEGEGVE